MKHVQLFSPEPEVMKVTKLSSSSLPENESPDETPEAELKKGEEEEGGRVEGGRAEGGGAEAVEVMMERRETDGGEELAALFWAFAALLEET